MPFLRDKNKKKHRVFIKPKAKLKFFKKIGLAVKKKQIWFFRCLARFIILIAGSRFGKSWIAAMEVTAELVLLPQKTKKALIWWIASPTEDLGMLEFDYIYDFLVMSGFIPVGQTPPRERHPLIGYVHRVMSPRPTLMVYYPTSWGIRNKEDSTLPGISIVQVRTGKRGHEHNYLGREVDGVVFSECAQFTNLKFILEHRLFRATTDRLGRFLMPTTPHGLGYLKDEVYNWGTEGAENKKRDWKALGPYKAIDGNMEMDEWDYWKELLGENSPGFQEQFMGLFTARSGRVYPDFIPETHVYTDADEYKFLSRSHYCNHEIVLGLDFGWENPSAVVFACKIGERYFIFDEIYGNHIPADDLADMIKEKLDYWNIETYTAFADVDYQVTNSLEMNGVFTLPARKTDKFTRREFVRSQFRIHPQINFPNIMLHKRCKNGIKELLEFHYAEDQREDYNLSEMPVEKDNHFCDALEYILWSEHWELWSTKKKEKVK